MATTTTNFGWDIPQSTDLVKDGATAIAALGQDIDTAMVDLKGGTTGQVLAKASGTDLDFSWVAQDDSNAIQNTQLTAKGALISAFSAGTPATLTVGTNGQVLTADSTAATGLAWATPSAGGGGKVLQVVSAATSTSTNITTSTFTDTTITATITPTLASSKILIMISANAVTYSGSSGTYVNSKAQIVRGASAILTNLAVQQSEGASANPISILTQSSYIYLDSPSTTSATTYKLQAGLGVGAGVRYQVGTAENTSTITLMEIGA
jgi:hypothetical protein